MIGKILRELRTAKNYSMKDVYKHTNISDSRLSRFECGNDNLSFNEVITLIEFYESTLLDVLLRCNLIDSINIPLKNIGSLNEYEISHIQSEIDFILRLKEEKNDF